VSYTASSYPCVRCGELKEKGKRCVPCWNTYNRGRRVEHPERERRYHAEYQAAWRKANPHKDREYTIRNRYGLEAADYQRLYEHQGGKCAICGKPEERAERHHRLTVDHDHSTGRVRGLLCFTCNLAIGLLQDDAALVASARDYLEDGGSGGLHG
jgi:hypothetical protein